MAGLDHLLAARIQRPPLPQQVIRDLLSRDDVVFSAGDVQPKQRAVLVGPFFELEPGMVPWYVEQIPHEGLAWMKRVSRRASTRKRSTRDWKYLWVLEAALSPSAASALLAGSSAPLSPPSTAQQLPESGLRPSWRRGHQTSDAGYYGQIRKSQRCCGNPPAYMPPRLAFHNPRSQ